MAAHLPTFRFVLAKRVDFTLRLVKRETLIAQAIEHVYSRGDEVLM
jgi:hypothetical protein